MSLLDDLKKQAQNKNVQATGIDKKTLQKNEHNWHILAPKFHTIYNYYKELAENLNILSPEDRISYQLSKTVTFNNLKKQEFRVAKTDPQSLRVFAFRYDLVGDRDIQVTVNNLPMAEKMRNMLSERGFRFVDKMESQTRIVFTVNPKITVNFEYSADLENCLAVLKIDNFDGAWSQMVRYSPESINEGLLDETAKYILGKPNKFQELSGNRVSEDMREKLRAKLVKDGKIPKDGKIEQKPVDKLESTSIRLKNLFKK